MNTTELEIDPRPQAIVNCLFAECLNEGDLSLADQLVSPDFTGPSGKGPASFKAMISPLRQGFPDLQFTIQEMVAEGSRVVVRWTSHGTHRGMFAGTAATGRQVSNEGIGIYRVEDGKIRRVAGPKWIALASFNRLARYPPSDGPIPRLRQQSRLLYETRL